ncbi:VWA domain-containing protein [Paenibacillus gorillae]|uniref:VWA domain-containing protein n=1 Tax=Paenibacillus gorillae TaxID=1243662 RepID=UPI001EE235D8|nr:VWA domain-containing protein [Paenibacillus gorillae]
MQVNSPVFLLLLLPWALFVWWMLRGTARLKGGRKAAVVAIRSVIMLLLIAIAAQVQPYWTTDQRNVVFVADRSASVNADRELGEWIAKAMKDKSADDRGGIVAIGLDAAVERALSPEQMLHTERYSFRAKVNGQFTDVSQGLWLASGLLQQAGRGRIVVMSDGAENAGSMLRQANMLKNAGIAVDVVPITPPQLTDAAIESFTVPQALRQGEKFNFEFTINSTTAGNGELRLYADNRELSRSTVQLEAGENQFALQSAALEPGFHQFRAELYAEGDEREQNNVAYGFSKVNGPPNVLIVEGEPGSSGNVEAALKASFIGYDTIAPERLSVELASYAAYDSIILNNVPATRIAEKPMEWIAKAVSDYGIGLVMLGGNDSFGLGGYFKTPVERALPVYMDLKGKRQIPTLGLVLVIDRSGSMDGGKLELAKEAAMRTIELMRDEDTVAVVAFDSSPWWIVEPTKLTDRKKIISQIQGIQPEGGTEIYTALSEAYKKLLEVQAQRKHIILLTDGQSSTNPGYSALTSSMVDKQMTMSTVAVGDGADQMLLKSLAEAAKGRYYFTKDESTLPAIFSRETVMMSRTYIVEQTFTPALGQSGNWSALWKNGLPQLNAYIATTAKETAEIALLSPDGDPILARWPYGSGRAVAWTSDMTGRWSRDWVNWQSLPGVLTEWIKWTFPQFESVPYQVNAELDGRKANIVIRSESGDSDLAAKLKAVVNNDAGETQKLEPIPIAPGEYEASMSVTQPGVYLMRIGGEEGGGSTSGFVIPYSPEYKLSSNNGSETLEQLAEATGGRVLSLDKPGEAFRFDPEKQRQLVDWSRSLLIAALLLLLADIALRRISIPWSRLAGWLRLWMRGWSRGGLKAASNGDLSSQSVSRLQERKSRTADFYDKGKDEGSNINVSHSEGANGNSSKDSRPSGGDWKQPDLSLRKGSSDLNAGGKTMQGQWQVQDKVQGQGQGQDRVAQGQNKGQGQGQGSGQGQTQAQQGDGNDKMSRLLAAKNRTKR